MPRVIRSKSTLTISNDYDKCTVAGMDELGSPRKRNKPHGILVAKTCLWFISLPEAQKAPPKECKQLDAVETVR